MAWRWPICIRPETSLYRYPPEDGMRKGALNEKLVFSGDVASLAGTGHQLYLECIRRAMARIEPKGQWGSHSLLPLSSSQLERAKRSRFTR